MSFVFLGVGFVFGFSCWPLFVLCFFSEVKEEEIHTGILRISRHEGGVTSIKHVSIPRFVYTHMCTCQLLHKSCSICSYQ